MPYNARMTPCECISITTTTVRATGELRDCKIVKQALCNFIKAEIDYRVVILLIMLCIKT